METRDQRLLGLGVCRSKEEEGMGVLNLKTQNEPLILKHLYKFFNKEDIRWSP